MKARESGMPEETYWERFFDADAVLKILFKASGLTGHLVEFGCGYGTFTVPAALQTQGTVTALDIDPQMVERVRQKIEAHGLSNVQAEVRDFVADGTASGTACRVATGSAPSTA